MSALKKIAIFGAGGFGLEVAMLIEQINSVKKEWDIIGFFDDNLKIGKMVNGYPVLGGSSDLNAWERDLFITYALGISSIKVSVVNKIKNPHIANPILIHPSVILGDSKYLTIGEGSIICAGNIITTNISIGKHVILNLSCTVGHETTIGDYSAFMPTCNISGEVTVGQASFWGTGAKTINKVKIGDNTVIGAGAVVIRDIPSNTTAVGVPAKVVNTHKDRGEAKE